ncbi:MAG: endolytic transglycosylase MltG [Ignavibacteriae bacterium]|nr:endolytic transglycosylase MltG [Ignavibacteria bacterium]MBI3363981.1 endolytic transglycosylase MltG [Ignavibacteriota bacterium]
MKRRLVTILLSVLALGMFILYQILWAPNTFEGDRFIIVSKGETFQSVLDSLEKSGVVRSRMLFSAAGRMLELTTKMQIGKYRFRNGMSNKEILEDLRYGKTIEAIMVTLPEGSRAARQARILSHQLGIDTVRFMSLVTDSAFCRSVGVDAPTLEGYLMPNTYKLYWQMDEEDVIKEIVQEFWKAFNDTLRADVAAEGMTLNEALTIASIVEGETSVDSERAVVAGVYYNRLKKNMRLQADPTIQYIIGDGPRLLHRSDLARTSAYNTYRHEGLPPGPVNNPGKASIIAALHPKKHKYLFFVANGLGGHTFTKTYNQHLKAVNRYKKIREEQQAIKEGQG